MSLRLHDYAASANCYKVRLLLAQLGHDYERVPVDIFGGDTLTDEYARLNPQRQTPVLEMDGAEPLTESGAILVRLADGTEYLPEDPNDRAQVLKWLFFEQTEVIQGIAGLRFRLVTQRIRADGREALWRRSVGEAALRLLDDRLGNRDWLAGDGYSIADISLFAYVHVAHEAGFELSEYPNIGEWTRRVEGTRGYMNDLEPYPPNSMAGESRSIYD
ncbi:MAG TPA: glutathione S-transferase family protein [Thermoleophilaceae bacterium]|nr:glutathione S-transferase family protein [Thermoleophilaceae bacterium]